MFLQVIEDRIFFFHLEGIDELREQNGNFIIGYNKVKGKCGVV